MTAIPSILAVLIVLAVALSLLIFQALARAFPNAHIRGIELSPLPYWVARFRTRKLPNVSLQRGNFFKFDLRDAQAVTSYLMIKPMPKLAAFLDQTLNPGTPVVSLTFWFRGRQPAATRDSPGLRGAAALYYWPAQSPQNGGADPMRLGTEIGKS
jgi:hypothetical protein